MSRPWEFLPLTPAQEGIWFAQQLATSSHSYNAAEYVELTGELDVPAFARAVAATLAEAAFVATVGEDRVQHRAAEPVLEVVEADGVEEALASMRGDCTTPVDLAAGPLARQVLYRVGPRHHLWYQRFHHVLVDGYGFALLARRVAEHCSGRAPAPWFGSLTEVLTAEREYATSARRVVDRDFWLARATGSELPTFAAARQPAGAGAIRVSTTFPAQEKAWPARLTATFAGLLARWSGADEVTLGLPLMNRMGWVASRVPCTTVNVMPLRLRGPRDFAAVVESELRQVAAHQRYRGEDLRRDLGLGAAPLCGPELNIRPFGATLDFGAVTGELRYLRAGPVADLALNVHRTPEGVLVADLDANPACYTEDDLHGHLDRLVAAFSLDVPVWRAAVGPASGAVGPAVPLEPVTLPELLAAQAERTPDATALVVPGEDVRLTFAEFDAVTSAFARRLVEAGVRTGDVVGVHLARGAALVVALHAVVKAGAAYTPLDPAHPAGRTEQVLASTGAVVVVTAAEFPSGAKTVAVDLDALLADAGEAPETGVRPGDAAYVIHTSGSTGAPKGVVISHAALHNRLAWMAAEYGIGPGDRVLQKTPAGFDVSVWEFFLPALTGAALVVAAPGGHADPTYVREVLRAHQITTVHFVPSMLAAFLAGAHEGFPFLSRVICSGEALPGEVRDAFVAAFPGVELHNLYGPTEAAIDVTAWPAHTGTGRDVPIGTPIWNTAVHVLDQALQHTPAGALGELYLAGAGVATGYLGRPGVTSERFVADPFGPPGTRMYRTGDLARRRADGVIEYAGRADDQVKVRGMRVEPGEVAAVLRERPGVTGAVVVARRRAGDTELVGYVTGTADLARLRAALAEVLPEHLVPAAVLTVDEFPLSANGKLDRSRLPEPDRTAGAGDPDTPHEEVVCRLFADELGLPSVGPDDDFFALGGHSVAVARLVGRVQSALGLPVGIADVFAAASPRRLVRHLGGTPADPLAGVLPLRAGGTLPPLFCLPPAGGLGWCYTPLLRVLGPDRPIYAVQARGLTDDDPGPATLRAVAAGYVERIREIQPHGPYHLLGWSVGGMVAHEMAVELQEAGEEVASLVLLDAYPSDQWRHLPAPTERDALVALSRIAGQPDPGEDLDRAAVLEALRRGGSALAALPSTTLARVTDVVRHSSHVVRDSVHRRWRGTADLFVADEPRAEDWLDPGGWQSYVDGEVRVHRLPCTHPEMVSPEHLSTIARIAL
ncbi:amino acid adenylation domain-containing protein [Lentzea sp. NPDC058436]|uniref:amino acid adenylation domain-containing protein n=1 Tax=Lentzea sp. NPDC058436 TaxID=3346499 RepID=UPI00366622B8